MPRVRFLAYCIGGKLNFKVKILEEHGYESAMLGLSLSYNKPVAHMKGVADKIYANGSHGKFLESIQVWLDITAPRYWYQEFSTYRIGVSCNSESTMHTIMKKELTQDDFVTPIFTDTLENLNYQIAWYNKATTKESKDSWFQQIKSNLPEGFLQRRIVATNYKTLRHIISQRKNHRLVEWQEFCKYLQENCRYKEWLE